MLLQLCISVPPEISPFSFSSDVVNEGIYAQVSCIVQSGDLPITITWSLKGDVISSEPGLMTAQIGQRASILSIDSVGYRHSGTYTCTARNEAGTASTSAELKVNGTLEMILLKPFFYNLRSMESIGWFSLLRSGCCTIDL